MFPQTISIGRIFGIPIGFHTSWVLIFGLLSWLLASEFQGLSYPNGDIVFSPPGALLLAVVTSLLLFASIVLHELGHSVVALHYGIAVRSITLHVFGGVAITERDAPTAKAEFWIAIAGPLVSFALAGIFWVLAFWIAVPTTIVMFGWLAKINLVLAIFNLLPGFPLDGGRVFRAIVWGLTGSASKGLSWAIGGGKLVALGLAGWGVLQIIESNHVLAGVWPILIASFLYSTAKGTELFARLSASDSAHQVGRVMREVDPWLSAETTVAEWLEREGGRTALVGTDDSVDGFLARGAERKVAEARRASEPVGTVATPLGSMPAVTPTSGGQAVLELMQHFNLDSYPVIDRGRVVGWLERDAVDALVSGGLAA